MDNPKGGYEFRLQRAMHAYRSPWDLIAKSLRLLEKDAQGLREGKVLMTLRVNEDLLLPSFNFEDVIARKIRGYDKRTKLTGQEFIDGALELQRVLSDPEIINPIVKEAYDEIIQPVLQTRAGERSLERGGKGLYREAGKDPQEQLAIQAAGKQRFFTRHVDELGSKWKQVWDLITAKGKIVSTGVVQGFNMEEILSIKMDSVRSNFTSVYMMAEFGTGQVADPGPRRYQSRSATPHKISPTLAALGGGDTSWWLSIGKSKLIAFNMLKARTSIMHTKFTRRTKLRHVDALKTQHLFDFAQGAVGKRSIKPRNIIFNARGMVLELKAAYEEASQKIARDVNDYVSKKVPNWPDQGLRLNFRPFLFPQIPRIVK